MSVSATTARRRVRVRIDGTVQGVGFRAFLYRLARCLELAGFAYRDARGVVAEVEGDAAAVADFLRRVRHNVPPQAVVDQVDTEDLPPVGEPVFRIVSSEGAGLRGAPGFPVPPDVAPCSACLAELFDPRNRRHRFPFICCAECGPRFTLVRDIPWRRENTTMASFAMCEACRHECDDPHDRRFHAVPNACPACGPSLRLVDGHGDPRDAGPGRDAVRAAAHALRGGAIVALKGVGGFHLACRADDPRAVGRLRERKSRSEKPFAVMVPGLAAARRLAWIDETEAALLAGRERPIVLVRRRSATHLASSVAPGHRDLGLMLPSSPLHHLLVDDTGLPLVMTSGNISGEPIAIHDQEALSRLAWIADLFLLHDREIASRAEDSVVRVVTMPDGRHPLMIRHSRGFAPAPLPLPVPAHPPVVGLGGQQRNTFTLASGERAWVGHHIGDLDTVETLHSLREGIAHLGRLFEVTPGTIAHDAHPGDLPSRRAAGGTAGSCLTEVPHHLAHFAACLGEHGEMGRAVGLVFDGRGYGDDGTVWGGEILFGDIAGVERVGYLWPVRMPGGEAAIQTPWRMACAWLASLSPGVPPMPPTLEGYVSHRDWERAAQLARDPSMPITTSVGRLLDALSALCGVCPDADYEGQAAVELEMVADEQTQSGYPLPVRHTDRHLVLDARRLVRSVRRDLRSGVPVPIIAARAHIGLAEASARAAMEVARARGVAVVALSGGVFQNVVLLERVTALLAHGGLRWLVPRRLPPNDGGLSYGQAVVAASRVAAGGTSGA